MAHRWRFGRLRSANRCGDPSGTRCWPMPNRARSKGRITGGTGEPFRAGIPKQPGSCVSAARGFWPSKGHQIPRHRRKCSFPPRATTAVGTVAGRTHRSEHAAAAARLGQSRRLICRGRPFPQEAATGRTTGERQLTGPPLLGRTQVWGSGAGIGNTSARRGWFMMGAGASSAPFSALRSFGLTRLFLPPRQQLRRSAPAAPAGEQRVAVGLRRREALERGPCCVQAGWAGEELPLVMSEGQLAAPRAVDWPHLAEQFGGAHT